MKAIKHIAVALAFASAAALAQSATELRIGVEAEYPPFESKSASGQLQGFDIDVGNAICSKIKVKCVWVENSFDGLIPALKARKFDAIHSAMNITEERGRTIAFSDPIYSVPMQLVARKGSPITPTVAALKGKHVGVLQGSTMETYAKARWAGSGVDVASYADQEQVYADLQAGRLDASLQESQQAIAGFLSRPAGKDFGFAGPAVEDAKIIGPGIGIGLRKNDEALRKQINQAIAQLKADGTLEGIARKYFQVPVISKTAP
ncbi:ABC transporter substrate-binding protein [Andreprevotia chitinilytica]|uniref:ABC transporter substrate-binding protein n=1 Tax=Andreprevotia chitinilytica TaxID=396808 RepID=UPI00055659E3|nr:ABC transporter substrate-binding protein [Andreprevotia chitinilytica]